MQKQVPAAKLRLLAKGAHPAAEPGKKSRRKRLHDPITEKQWDDLTDWMKQKYLSCRKEGGCPIIKEQGDHDG